MSTPDRSEPHVTVVVVTHNAVDTIGTTLRSLEASSCAERISCVVVDSGSSDDTVDHVKREFPWVRILPAQNIGFAAANNLGAEGADSEYLFLLNPDAWVESSTIERLIEVMRSNPSAGVVGATVRHPGGAVQEIGNRLDWFGFPIPQRRPTGAGIVRDVFFVSGCAMLMRTADWVRVGGFDSRLFMFVEEVDLCWRMQMIGRSTIVAADATVWHVGGASLEGGYAVEGRHRTSSLRVYLRERNTLAVTLRNGGVVEIGAAMLGWLGNLVEVLGFTAMGRRDIAGQYGRALAWNVRHLRETLALRATTAGRRPMVSAPRGRSILPGKLVLLRQSGIPKAEG